ncbi:MAG: hypothetical protein HUK22_06625 [Thermoguttaceae bacterium]|nr:hypothetical protein [Thermoguttaceae bacterium]
MSDGVVKESYAASAKSAGAKRNLRVVILLDGESASASEIVAAALQDAGVAKICGRRSYGKGTVQELFELPCKLGMLRVTTASYWRPSERPIQRNDDSDVWGVDPDEGLEAPLSAIDNYYRKLVRGARTSRPDSGTLDAPVVALLTRQVRDALSAVRQNADKVIRAEALAEIDVDLRDEDEMAALLGDGINENEKFTPKGREPRFDPTLDVAVDYLTSAEK